MADFYETGFEKSTFAIFIGYIIAGVTFLCGYCIYSNLFLYRKNFKDKKYFYPLKRRKDSNKPNYAFEYIATELKNCSPFGYHFIEEIQLSEIQFLNGDYHGGVVHLANALAWSEKPRRLLEVMRSLLSPSIYKMLINEILEPALLEKDVSMLTPETQEVFADSNDRGCEGDG